MASVLTRTKPIFILGGALVLLAISPVFNFSQPAQADRLESDSYVIQFGNFNMGSGETSGTNYNITYTMGQIAPGPYGDYGSTNFIGAGFQYIYQIGKFEFTISDTDLDFGVLTPLSHNTVSNQLTISTRGAGGYTIYAYEQHPLQLINGTTEIDDTNCDSGTCDEAEAKPWTTESVPGFGFNIAGDNVSTDFTSADPDCTTDTECFRQFADNSAGESMQTIMSSNAVAQDETATVTYKAGIPGIQAAGHYQTGVVFVAVPGY